MNEFKIGFISIAGAVGGSIATFFGGWDAGLKTLVAFMAVDYLMGLVIGGILHKSPKTESGTLKSDIGFKGLIKKGAALAVVFVAFHLDSLMGTTVIRDGVVIAFVVNETISIIENAGIMGVPIPPILTKAIDMLAKKSEEVTK